MNSKELKGIPVLSIADGEKLGTVSRAYVDAAQRRIFGFAYTAGGGFLQTESEPKLDLAEVHSLGPDALMLDHKGGETGASVSQRYSELLVLDEIASLPLLSEGGIALGKLASIEFDATTYELTGLDVSHGAFSANKRIGIDRVTAIGRDYVIVADVVSRSDEARIPPDASDASAQTTTYVAQRSPG
jgi:uncharacterized protein YrrD